MHSRLYLDQQTRFSFSKDVSVIGRLMKIKAYMYKNKKEKETTFLITVYLDRFGHRSSNDRHHIKCVKKSDFRKNRKTEKNLDSPGIEPGTTPMLREYYTTKPQAPFDGNSPLIKYYK